jgi:uncharacterized protein
MNLALTRGGRFADSEALSCDRNQQGYSVLPFRFERLGDERGTLVTNEVGEYCVVPDETISRIAAKSSIPQENFKKLERIHVLARGEDSAAYSLLPLKLRRKYRRLSDFTSLHMLVVTLRCNQSCPYCQVSRQSEDRLSYDMSEQVAERAIQHIFRSPSKKIKIEFQGGESLLNFELIKWIVIRAKEVCPSNVDLAFVAATNLTYLTDEIVEFFGREGVLFSTSIDGPTDLHNVNRPYRGRDAFEVVCQHIRRIQDDLGPDSVAALMTTTARSLPRARDIVDQYIALGFRGMFLRSLSPYGFALKTKTYYEYSAKEWLAFYVEALDYILEINRQGYYFEEFYTKLVARRMLDQEPDGYVDLQSPTGSGIMGVVYDYDGKVYVSDEARMLAQMGDHALQLGHVEDSYEDLFLRGKLPDLINGTMTQSAPMCHSCAFQPWCGSEPSYHHSTQRDFLGHKAYSGFCHKQMGIFRHLLDLEATRPEDWKQILNWIG